MIRVRIAPSPTGIPHIGNTRTALFNYLFAKHNKGKFILRIEDTDRARIVPQAEKAIYEILDWLGILWDEKYVQSERLDIYHEHVDRLIKKDMAYKEEGAVRFRISTGKEISWQDAIGNKKISFKSDILEDFVILKSDGFPTYHLANVVDDSLMEISHVIRGDEWISSTPKHILLYEAFGWKPPLFAHLPVILGPDKKKLSKRHGAKSALDYRDEGFFKEALLNFMVLLGWNPGGDKEIISLDEMINMFDLSGVNTASPIFDIQKLEWMNGVYIRQKTAESLEKEIVGRFGEKLKPLDKNMLKSFVKLAKSRIKTLNEFYELIKPFTEDVGNNLSKKEEMIAKKLLDYLSSLNSWDKDSIFSEMKRVLNEEKVKMPILYKILIGKEKGLPLPETLEILGKKSVVEKLKKVIV